MAQMFSSVPVNCMQSLVILRVTGMSECSYAYILKMMKYDLLYALVKHPEDLLNQNFWSQVFFIVIHKCRDSSHFSTDYAFVLKTSTKKNSMNIYVMSEDHKMEVGQ